jgi:hypothetical protein
MDTKKIAKIATTIIIVAVPFGLTAIAGYYSYKKYKEVKEKKEKK